MLSHALTFLACAALLAESAAADSSWSPERRWRAKGLQEPSALVQSRRHPGVLWTLNDSGGKAELFAFDRHGKHIGIVKVRGAQNRDWESLTLDDSGRLYIADTGNNKNDRRNLLIYVVEEPDPWRKRSVRVKWRVPFGYRDQKHFPPREGLPFDVEASFFADGRLHLLTKDRSQPRTRLYRFEPIVGDAKQRLESNDSVASFSMVTGADLHPDGRRLAVLSYDQIQVFERTGPGAPLLANPPRRSRIEVGQAEGIAWDGEDLLVVSESCELHRIGPSIWRRERRYVAEPPAPLAVARALTDGSPATPIPLRWSRPGIYSPPGPPPADLPRVAAALGWTERGLVLDLYWPDRPQVDRGEPLAMIMVSALPTGAGPADEGNPAWSLLWEGAHSPPAPRSLGPTRGRPLPQVMTAGETGERWWTRVALPAEALPGWEGAAGAGLAFNVVLLGPEPTHQWCYSVDASTWCWSTPDLWGALVLEGREP